MLFVFIAIPLRFVIVKNIGFLLGYVASCHHFHYNIDRFASVWQAFLN